MLPSQGRKRGDEPHKRGLNTKVHLAVDAFGMPIRVLVTEGTAADCAQAANLPEGLSAQALLADKAYDTDAIVTDAESKGIQPVIPPKPNRKNPRAYDEYPSSSVNRW